MFFTKKTLKNIFAGNQYNRNKTKKNNSEIR